MKGDGEDCVVPGFWSGGERDGMGTGTGTGNRNNSSRRLQGGTYSLYLTMLSSLSRNGLSMLAGGGGSNGGFILKPRQPSTSLRNLASSSHDASALNHVVGRFTGLTGYRAALVAKSARHPGVSPMGMGMRFESGEALQVKEEAGLGASCSHFGSSIVGKREQPGRTGVQEFTTDECWRLILKLGSQWPAWNGATASHQQGLMKANDSTFEVADHGHHSRNEERVQGGSKPVTLQRGQDFLKLLTSRALEALAQTPLDHHGKAAGGMVAPKQTTQAKMDSKAAGNAPLEAPTKLTEPTSLTEAPSSSRERLAPKSTSTRPRTAALTIFYDGIVNVCDNVPADKARLIMMFAEKAGVSLNAQALLRSVKCVTPSLGPLSQDDTPALVPSRSKHSKPSSQVALQAGTPSGPSDLPSSASHVEGSASDQEPAESSNPAKIAIAEPSPLPLRITVTPENNFSRHHVMVKPLPNARKNSLARFLDSRKRGTASCSSEGGSSKKQALGDGCSSDADDAKGSGKSPVPLCSQSLDSKEGICAMCTNALDRAKPDTEMQD